MLPRLLKHLGIEDEVKITNLLRVAEVGISCGPVEGRHHRHFPKSPLTWKLNIKKAATGFSYYDEGHYG